MNTSFNFNIPDIFFRKYFQPISIAILFSSSVMGQNDTNKIKSVEIISSFKPSLLQAVKIDFSGSQLTSDTSRNIRMYEIPAQNLTYNYKSIPLKPLALSFDTLVTLGDRNFVKAGFGNYSTPYFKAGLSFGDGSKKLLNIYADYTSSRGKLQYQNFSNFSAKATGSYFFSGHEAYANVGFRSDRYYLFGYDQSLFNFTKQDLLQQFNEVDMHVGLRNTQENRLGVSYNPNIRVNLFSLSDQLNETTAQFNLPVEKSFGESFFINVNADADLTKYSTKNVLPSNILINNNVIKIKSLVSYYSDRFNISAGITPVWDNGKFVYFPNIYADYELSDKALVVQAGWIGDIQKNTFRSLSAINPFLRPVSYQNNTRETELFGGIKSSLGTHFSFNAKAGFLTYRNYQFYVNDTSALSKMKDFKTSNENILYNFRIHGDAAYTIKDKFTVTAGLTLNGFTGITENEKAWHTIPIECTAAMRWWISPRLMTKADFYFFAGSPYLQRGNQSGRLSGADLSAGLEFKINKSFSAFANVNNIFNNTYQRWYNYPVYGLNFLGGVVYRFASLYPFKSIH
jgi:hypothetical protein